MDAEKNNSRAARMLNFVGIACFIVAVVFIILLFLSGNDNVRIWYQNYLNYLMSAEYKVEHANDKFSIFLILIFLFAFKAVFPIYLYPVSALCAVTSAVFPPYLSMPINYLGLAMLYSIKYYWGVKLGASGARMILQKNATIRYLIEKDGQGNPWILVLLRVIPGVPINTVSQLYGSMRFPYLRYLLLSLAGYTPLLVFYTIIGHNVFNPLSVPFLLPLVLLFILLGVSAIATGKIIQIQSKRRKINAGSQ